MAKIERDELVLSTGKRIYVCSGDIGIDNDLEPCYGFDGVIEVVDWQDKRPILSHAERRELADYAISLWRQFAALTDDELFMLPREVTGRV